MLFTATLEQDSVSYLATLTQASPLEFYASPKVYLSTPSEGIRIDLEASLSEFVGLQIPLRFAAARTLFNVNTQRSELDILLQVDLALVTLTAAREALLPLANPNADFVPYFSWCIEPNRSRTARAFIVSLINSLHTDNFRFTAISQITASQDPLALVFNPATMTASNMDSAQLYRQQSF